MKQNHHRSHDEVTRQILNLLHDKGPCSILQIEYGVEINHRQTTRLLPLLIAANVIGELFPNHPQFKKVRLRNAVSRLFKITAKGRKCMDLMNQVAQQLNTPINVQYNVRRGGYFLPSAVATIPATQGKV